MFKIIKKEGAARRAIFETPHGTVQMPAFMNVATCGAIKGAVSAFDPVSYTHLKPTVFGV